MTGALGWVRERGPGEGRESAERRKDPGGLGVSLVWLEAPACRAGAGGGIAGRARAGTQLLLLLAGEEDGVAPVGWARTGVGPGR